MARAPRANKDGVYPSCRTNSRNQDRSEKNRGNTAAGAQNIPVQIKIFHDRPNVLILTISMKITVEIPFELTAMYDKALLI